MNKANNVTTCEPLDTPARSTSESSRQPAREVCKPGVRYPESDLEPNVLIIGDSVSAGYMPFIQKAVFGAAFVQHAPWVMDAFPVDGAGEPAYFNMCFDYMLRAPDGTPLRPDVAWFNFGLHSLNLNPRKPEYGLRNYASTFHDDLRAVTEKLVEWSKASMPRTKLIFGLTTPMLYSENTDGLIRQHNEVARTIMSKHGVATVDMHAPVVQTCGQASGNRKQGCFGDSRCWDPHCSQEGYMWLANTVIAPAIRAALHDRNGTLEELAAMHTLTKLRGRARRRARAARAKRAALISKADVQMRRALQPFKSESESERNVIDDALGRARLGDDADDDVLARAGLEDKDEEEQKPQEEHDEKEEQEEGEGEEKEEKEEEEARQQQT